MTKGEKEYSRQREQCMEGLSDKNKTGTFAELNKIPYGQSGIYEQADGGGRPTLGAIGQAGRDLCAIRL